MARFNTQLVHGEPVNDNDTRAVNPPIYKSSTFAFESVDAMPRWDYARSGNPTREYLERQIAQLEHGTRGFAFASGSWRRTCGSVHFPAWRPHRCRRQCLWRFVFAAERAFQPLGSGGHVSRHPRSGRCRACCGGDPKRGIQPAKAVYFETVTNPLLKVNDVHAIAEIAHRYGTIVIVDNTFVTPYLQNPLDLGADIVRIPPRNISRVIPMSSLA